MAWWQLSVTACKDQAPLLELLFEEIGALSITLADAGDAPLLEPGPQEAPLWDQVRVIALFEGTRDSTELISIAQQSLQPKLTQHLTLERLEDQAWERCWLDYFHPMRFGPRLWVSPTGQTPPVDDAIVVTLDPGLAFGTGTHPTTALCLSWLDRAELSGKRIIDYGCGSGILGIAAIKLGANQVCAVDHDPQALEASRENAQRNGVAQHLRTCLPGQLKNRPVDLLLANILAQPLIDLAPTFGRLLSAGGKIVLSGILQEQTAKVCAAYQEQFDLAEPLVQEEWVLLEGTRKPAIYALC